MTMMFQELSERRQRRLDADEQVLWCGKGRPVSWHDGAIGSCVMGFFICVFVGVFAAVVLPGVFGGQSSGGVRFGAEALATVLITLFGSVGISQLFAPFWHWLATRAYVWVITNRRVLRFNGPFVTVWEGAGIVYSLLEEPAWEFLDDGGRNFAFGESGSKQKTDIIESVPPEDVPRVESALLRLAKLRREARESAVPGKMQSVRGRFRVIRDETKVRRESGTVC